MRWNMPNSIEKVRRVIDETRETVNETQQKKNFVASVSAKETVYSLVIITGVVALSGLASLILYEFCSRETPKGIFKEASKLCLADSRVS